MPVARDLTTVLTAAETAAVAGDFKAAAAELREALAIQEATLGSSHPDLADTLNNLGVASERARQLDDAERYYRRALAVATAAFDAGHPFVATSRENLREFCEANGRSFDPPKAAAAPAAPQKPQPKPQPQPPPQQEAKPKPQPKSEARPKTDSKPKTEPPPAPRVAAAPAPVSTPVRRASMAPVVIGVIVGVIVIVALIMLVLLLRGRSGGTNAPDASAAAAAPPATAPPAANSSPARAGRAASGGFPAVLNPRLCRRLVREGDWTCDRATSPVPAGSLTFFTRVRSDRDLTVQHRWYRGQAVVKSMQVQIVANPTEGYRTYSQYVVPAGAAEWRVELRSSDGTVLHEEKFVVR